MQEDLMKCDEFYKKTTQQFGISTLQDFIWYRSNCCMPPIERPDISNPTTRKSTTPQPNQNKPTYIAIYVVIGALLVMALIAAAIICVVTNKNAKSGRGQTSSGSVPIINYSKQYLDQLPVLETTLEESQNGSDAISLSAEPVTLGGNNLPVK